jgi:hypothetical protein
MSSHTHSPSIDLNCSRARDHEWAGWTPAAFWLDEDLSLEEAVAELKACGLDGWVYEGQRHAGRMALLTIEGRGPQTRCR